MEVDENVQKASLMSTLNQLFSSTKPAVKKLLGWRSSEEEEKWAEKAIEALVKRLKKKRGALDDLTKAVSNPKAPSRCVTIPKSLDGRLQVLHRKGMPHVIYCRLWRWSDLKSHHELRPLPCCRYPFGSKSEEICINPYHYRRIDSPVLPDIVVPSTGYQAPPSPETLRRMQQATVPTMPKNITLQVEGDFIPSPWNPQQQQQQQQQRDFIPSGWNPQQQQQNSNSNSNFWNPNQQQQQQQHQQSDFIPSGWNPQQQQQNSQNPQNYFGAQGNWSATASPPCPQFSSNNLPFGTQQSYASDTIAGPVNNNNQLNSYQPRQNAYKPRDSEAIPYVEPCNWASIAYYELNGRVGEIFHCTQSVITVDGFTDPANDGERFSLGRLSNINRNTTIENTRRSIGNGVQFHYAGGELYAECHSDYAVFVQSKICNRERNFHPDTVIKMPSKCSLKIFDMTLFGSLLNHSVQQGFESVYELTKMCTIRMSFVKGWGNEYQRNDVTATPCWIEIHLNGPLKWLDNVLIGMGSPQFAISSVS